MKDLDSFLKKDALDFVNRIYRGKLGKQAVDFKNLSVQELKNGLNFYKRLGNLKNIKDLDKLVINELKQNKAVNSFVSDLLGGVTDNMLVIEYGHETTYWQQKGHLEAEAIAHFFEVVGSGGERLKMLKTCFPFSFAYFVGFIKDI